MEMHVEENNDGNKAENTEYVGHMSDSEVTREQREEGTSLEGDGAALVKKAGETLGICRSHRKKLLRQGVFNEEKPKFPQHQGVGKGKGGRCRATAKSKAMETRKPHL